MAQLTDNTSLWELHNMFSMLRNLLKTINKLEHELFQAQAWLEVEI